MESQLRYNTALAMLIIIGANMKLYDTGCPCTVSHGPMLGESDYVTVQLATEKATGEALRCKSYDKTQFK